MLPTPDPYRPDIVDADGEFDWRRQLDIGFAMIDAQSTGALAACIVEPILSSAGVVDPAARATWRRCATTATRAGCC